MKIIKMIKQLGGNRAAIAKQAGISVQQLNNMVSQGREVEQLSGGGFVVLAKNTVRFKALEAKSK